MSFVKWFTGTRGNDPSVLCQQYLRDGLGLRQHVRIYRILKKNGVSSVTELMLLCEPEREELLVKLNEAGICLGDRSKLKRAAPEAMSEWIRSRGSFSSGSSDSIATYKPKRHYSASDSGDSLGESASSSPDRPGGTVGTLAGAPAWWKEHDAKVLQLAKNEAQKQSRKHGEAAVLYPWQEQASLPHSEYQMVLWARRQEILESPEARMSCKLRGEWLALVLELDRVTGDGAKVHNCVDYLWYKDRNEPSYTNTLLARRTEMLALNLTKQPLLQSEWVLLVRELERTLTAQPQPIKREATSDDVDTDGIADENLTDDAKSLLISQVEAWQRGIQDTLPRSDSVCSFLTETTISRATSLASFYSAADSDAFCTSERLTELGQAAN